MAFPFIPLLVAILVAGVLLYVINALPGIDPSMKKIAHVLVVACVVLWIINLLTGGAIFGGTGYRYR